MAKIIEKVDLLKFFKKKSTKKKRTFKSKNKKKGKNPLDFVYRDIKAVIRAETAHPQSSEHWK